MCQRLVAAILQFLRVSSVTLNDLGNTRNAPINWLNRPHIALMFLICGYQNKFIVDGFQSHTSSRAHPMPNPNWLKSYFDSEVNSCCLSANGRAIGVCYPLNIESFNSSRRCILSIKADSGFDFNFSSTSISDETTFVPIPFRLRMHQILMRFSVLFENKNSSMNDVHEWAFDANEFHT